MSSAFVIDDKMTYQQRLQHLLDPAWIWRILSGFWTFESARVISVVLLLTELMSFVVTIVIGDELSEEERIFQRPGPESFPAVEICLDIRELQLWALCNILSLLGGADLGLPLTLLTMLLDLTPTSDLGLCS